MKYECLVCEQPYLPYNKTIPCPKCGDKPEMEEYPSLIEGMCESLAFNISNYGSFGAMCWAVMDVSDSIQMYFFNIFKEWMKIADDYDPPSRTEEFSKFFKKALNDADWKDQSHMKEYTTKLGIDIYNEFFNVRNINIVKNGQGLKIKKGTDDEL